MQYGYFRSAVLSELPIFIGFPDKRANHAGDRIGTAEQTGILRKKEKIVKTAGCVFQARVL